MKALYEARYLAMKAEKNGSLDEYIASQPQESQEWIKKEVERLKAERKLTSHQIAKMLLDLPDLPLMYYEGGTPIVEEVVDDTHPDYNEEAAIDARMSDNENVWTEFFAKSPKMKVIASHP